MSSKYDGFDERTVDVFQIAEAYSKENMNAFIEPAHVFKALLHKDIGLVQFIEKTLNADYYYLLDWADMRIKMSKKSSDSSQTKSFSAMTKAVISEADSIRVNGKKEAIDPLCLLVAVITPGVGFSYEQLKTLTLQKEDVIAAIGSSGTSSVSESNSSRLRKETGCKNIESYCILKNKEQQDGMLSESVGFECELNEIYGILSRKTKSNILITGESGVGKTALINALVQAVEKNSVPRFMQDARIYQLDLLALSIGVSYKSEIEGRLKKILDEMSSMSNVILIIESLDAMLDKQGSFSGTVNLLKSFLNKGLLCICTSSVEGFTKSIEPDKELTGKFELIRLDEPSQDKTDLILRTAIKSFEDFHHLTVSEDFIPASIRLAKRYFTEKCLPESAIDLIDRTMALVKVKNDMNGTMAKMAMVEDMTEVISQKTGIPMGNVQSEERDRLINAEEILKKRVVGQDHAIKTVLDSIYESRSGLNKKGQPIGSFFFLGPTGTGKTELAKSLAEFLFQDDTAILRFDMSEYKEEHSVALLYGAPPGYVGYEEGGLLVNKIRQKPYSIVLFDEIEKAHRSVFDLFLQILDEGKLHDRLGRVGDFSNSLIIFTSNIGSQFVFEQFGKGVVPSHNDMMEIMQGYFRPEFLARLTEIIPFAPINENIVTMIFNIHLKGLLKTLNEQKITLNVDEKAIHKIAMSGFNAQYGARPILGILRNDIRRPLSKMIISGELKEGDKVDLTLDSQENLKWDISHLE